MTGRVQRDRDAAGVTWSNNGLPMALAVKFQLNPQAEPSIPTATAYERLESRRGKWNTEGAEPVSKHKIWPRRGGSVGRRGPRGLNLARESNKSGERNKGQGKMLYFEKITKQKKLLARKKRRRGRTERRLAKKQAERNRARTRRQEVCIATHNVRTTAVDGKHGIGRAWEVLSALRKLGCDVIGIQETRRSGQSVFEEAGYTVYCSGETKGKGELY